MANSLRASLPKRSRRPVRAKRGRAPWFIGLGVLAILVLAYIDGGEEPIRPISQAVSIPGVTAEGD